MAKARGYSPSLEVLEARWVPSTITHRGLTPILGQTPVPIVSATGPKPSHPRPPLQGGTYWEPQGGSTDGTLDANWTSGVPNAMIAGVFDPSWSNSNCNLGALEDATSLSMHGGYEGTVTFGVADTLGTLYDSSNDGWFTFNAAVAASGLTVDTGANFAGTSTFTLASGGTGTVSVPSGQTFIISCSDFIDNGSISASGRIYLGNGTSGTSFLSIGNGGTLNLSDNGSFAGSGSSNIRIGDSTTGHGTLEVAANKTWTSSVSVYLRTAGGSDEFSIDSGATWDFSGATFGYNGFTSVCLAEDGVASGLTNYVTLRAGATLNLFGNAVLNGSLWVYFQGSTVTDTIGTHSGSTATMIMNNVNATLTFGATGFGQLLQNTNVTWNGGAYNAIISFNAGSWSIDY